LGEIDDVAFNPFAQERDVEVNEQTQAFPGQSHIGMDLGFVNRQN
jgi:hypothetical protein